MYTAIAKVMVRSSRMRNFPAHNPASQSQTLPPQRREPASVRATQIDILYLGFILSDFFDFMRIPEVREVEFPFFFFSVLVFPTFFLCVFPSGRSFSFQGRKKVGLRTNKVYGENTTCNEMEVWRLSPERLATPTFFVCRSPELPLPLTTNNRSRCEYIE